jgi:hypothetical protein
MRNAADRRLSDVRKLIGDAIPRGAQRLSAMRFRWDISANCSSPYSRTLFARPHEQPKGQRPVWATVKPGASHSLELELMTRCRNCDNCRRVRASEWRYRCLTEVRSSDRTWFGTLTLSEANQFRFLTMARMRCSTQGVDFDMQSFGEQLKLRHREIAPEITRMLKRIRKGCQGPVRYIVILEAHKSGVPHYHLLIHEKSDLTKVRKSVLDANWPLGFCQWRLVDKDRPQSAVYITKYLSKSLAARVRASQGYGRD